MHTADVMADSSRRDVDSSGVFDVIVFVVHPKRYIGVRAVGNTFFVFLSSLVIPALFTVFWEQSKGPTVKLLFLAAASTGVDARGHMHQLRLTLSRV